MFSLSRTTWAITSFFTIALTSLSLQAAPTITSVDTSQLSQGLITIKGSGFGGSPRVDIYEDFEHSGAKHGDPIASDQAIVGNWRPHNGAPATYDDISLSGNFSADTWSNQYSRTGQLNHWFQTPVQSVYISYWVKIPAGYPFPGSNTSYQNYFSSESAWKFAWFIDADYQGNSSDLCVPTYTGNGSVMIAGNDANMAYLPKIDAYWSKGNWMRFSAWLYADPSAPTSNGRLQMKIWSAEHGDYTYDRQQAVFDNDGPTTKQYQFVNIPGWIRGFPNNNGRPLYDDIYIASGPNAVARVELTDAANYSKSSAFAIQKPISWTNTQITFQVIKSNIADINTAAVHVFDGSGNASNGVAISSTAAAPSTSPPLAPVLQVSVAP